MDFFFIPLSIAFRQVNHHFQPEQIGPSHDVAAAAGAEAVYQFFDHAEMELHGLLGGPFRQ